VAERYSVLLDLARTLTSTLVSPALYNALYQHVMRVLPTRAFTVALVNRAGGLETAFHAGAGDGSLPLGEAELEHLRAGDFVLRGGAEDGRALLAAPLAREGRLIGCVAVQRDGRPFDAAEANFLLAVGQLAAVAVDNARLFAEVRRRGEEAERLEVVARDLSGSLELSDVVERAAARSFEIVNKPVVVWLLEGARIRAVARAGGAMIRLGEERLLPPASIARLKAEALARSGGAGDGTTQAEIPLDAEGGSADQRERGRVLVPLTLGARLVGLLAVGPWGDEPPDPDQIALLHRMAPHASAAIENARLHDEVRRLSLTDPLVQLPNRRQLDLFLEKEFAAAERGRPLCFVLYDLDRFKEYNDTQGHRAGDVALIRFASVLRNETRAMNLAARYGGEEFATVLSGTDLAGGRAHAERVRQRCAETFGGEMTVSAGVAEYVPEMRTPVDLVVAADRALYRAKVGGRNRVCVADI
jgi:diguanylate cyclase (GGDEF)-like protein